MKSKPVIMWAAYMKFPRGWGLVTDTICDLRKESMDKMRNHYLTRSEMLRERKKGMLKFTKVRIEEIK